MKWLIINSNGKYVAKSGSDSSFTNKIECAAMFDSKEAAQDDCCGNEYPVSLNNVLGI